MRLITALARPMLASMFVAGGFDAARAPGPRTQAAEKLGLPQPELLVRHNGAAMVAGGTALALGYRPRRAALLLASTLVPTTYAGHAFWQHEGEAAKAQQTQFLKNLSMLGGLLVVAGDAPAKRGQPRSAKKAGKAVAKAAAQAARETERAQVKLDRTSRRKAAKVEAKAQAKADKIRSGAEKAAHLQAKDTKGALKTAKKAEQAAGSVADATQSAAKAEAKAQRRALKLSGKAVEQATSVQGDLAARRELADSVTGGQ